MTAEHDHNMGRIIQALAATARFPRPRRRSESDSDRPFPVRLRIGITRGRYRDDVRPAGSQLGYVFLYLLPKLGDFTAEIVEAESGA